MIEFIKKMYWDFNNLSRAESGLFILFPILGLTLLWFSFYNANLLMTDVENLSTVENKVISKNIKENSLIIKLNYIDSEFITDNLGVDRDLVIGNVVKIYYKKRIITNHLKILQLEKNNSILIAFTDIKKNSMTLMVLSAVIGFLFFGLFVFYRIRLYKK